MRVVVEVWWSSLVAADSRLLGALDPVERGRLGTMDRQADRGRSMVGFALLRVAVGQHLGIAPRDVLIDRTCADCGEPHGRPRVAGPRGAAPSVSVSHSGLLVVIALSEDTAVGVDVQRVAALGESAGAALPDVERWVRCEAVRKLGVDGRPDLHALATPLDGYAAALATLTPPDADVEVLVRHWDADSGGRRVGPSASSRTLAVAGSMRAHRSHGEDSLKVRGPASGTRPACTCGWYRPNTAIELVESSTNMCARSGQARVERMS